jgi:hypothetical protein
MLGVQSDQLESIDRSVRESLSAKSIPIGKVVFHSQVILGRPLI